MNLLRGFVSLLFATLCVLPASPLEAQATNIAATPPMGWNSWNHFHNKVDDATIRAQAEAMVSSGMRDAGYTYINIDDTWEGERDSSGIIHTNSKFPDMKALADFVHSKGLKIGIYSSPGSKTCAKFEGSYGHELQDAQTYAAWGIDYLKYDLCGLREQIKAAGSPEEAHKIMVDAYVKMRDALHSTGRPIVYSLCQYGNDAVWEWGTSVGGNLWRTTGDINDHYTRMETIGFSQAGLARFAAPGHWNDPDMLEVGNGGMTTEEYRAHFSLWSILAAPLIAGNDLRDMKPEIHDILTNKEVIAVNQDPLGSEGRRVLKDGDLEVWVKQMQDGSRAVVLLNRAVTEKEIAFSWENIGYPSHVTASVRDLWRSRDLGQFKQKFSATVAPHSAVMLKVAP
jgi:alpha-galactosidase